MKQENYDMFSAAGNRACAALVNRISKKIKSRTRLTASQVSELVEKGMDKISEKHDEVGDTEPRGMIWSRVSRALREAGYGFYFDSFGSEYSGIYPY